MNEAQTELSRFGPAGKPGDQTATISPEARLAAQRVSRERWLAATIPFALPILLLSIWQILTYYHITSPAILPSPSDVYRAEVHLAQTELWSDMLISTKRALTGFVLGGVLGFTFGLLNGLNRRVEQIFDSTIHAARTIPIFALIPLFILWFGIGEETKVFIVAIGVFFPIYLNTYHGVRSVDQGLIEVGRVYGLGPFMLFRKVVFPAALPSILVGVRFSLGVMWLALIVAETVAADSGIGYITNNARENLQTDVVIAGMLIYALLGKGADALSRGLEKLLLPWRQEPSKQHKS
jgi:sulfonate transport system permease protein